MIDFEQIAQEEQLWPWISDSSLEESCCEYEEWLHSTFAEDYADEDEAELNVETDYTYNVSNACLWDGWNVD
jgi:hypothetical protein